MKGLSLGIALVGALFLAFPTASDSCSISPAVPVFTTRQRPANLASEFLQGKVGVIQPGYGRRYLVGAYRILSGKPLSAAEADALYPPPKPSVQVTRDSVPGPRGQFGWNQAAGRVLGVGTARYVDPYRTQRNAGSVVSYLNCPDGAFDSAERALAERAQRWGAKDPRLSQWLNAQQEVFANCSGANLTLPAMPDATMDPSLAADRRYQIAAAYFYAGDWPKAREAFEEVSRDASSPWRGIAPYLEARTFIRQGTVDDDPDALHQAAERLQAIRDDPAQTQWHEASRKLLEFVNLRIDPTERLKELGEELMGRRAATDLNQSVTDFLYLYGRQSGSGTEARRLEDLRASSDLADWMLTFEGRSINDEAHAARQWKQTRSPAWLIAALAQGRDAEAVEAARHVDPAAPEYEAATYYALRGETDAAQKRNWLDEALSHKLTLSARNLFLRERLPLARDWNEFLRDSTRRPEPGIESWDGAEAEADQPPVSTGAAPLFDADAADALNRRLPFSLWADASQNRQLPAHLQLQVAEAAWVRALVLGKDAEAHMLMERIVRLRPEFATSTRDYRTASEPEAARFAAAFLLLRTPSLISEIEAGAAAGDLTKVSHLGAIDWGFADGCLRNDPTLPPTVPAFLSAAQQAENAAEWQQMAAAAPAGVSYLGAQVLSWARSHPEDSRLPEALHLVVQAGRRACRGQGAANYGQAAFQLLHRRYSNSEWTQKTRYWYQ